MNLKRLFTTEGVKGKKNYLDSQKKYEIIRTVIYFGISIALFAAGYITTGDRNLLTIVAVLGCLPASKSLVGAIMYCKYKSLSADEAEKIEAYTRDLTCLYDLIFTTREKTYPVNPIRRRIAPEWTGVTLFPNDTMRGTITEMRRM